VNDARRPTVENVLTAVRLELAERPAMRPARELNGTDPARQAFERARSLQRSFRSEPIGGRLVPLKRIVHWFVASAFDRQARVIEALLPALDEMQSEIVALRREVAELRRRTEGESAPTRR